MSDRDQRRLARWREQGEPVPVRLVAREGTSTEAVVYRKTLGSPERAWRALIVLGTCWLLAAVTVFIPLAHFVLVPGFLIAGPIVAYKRYGAQSVVMGGLATCPRCNASVRVKYATEDWPLSASCDACRAIVEVRRDPSSVEEGQRAPLV